GTTDYVVITSNLSGSWLVTMFFEGEPIPTGLPSGLPSDSPTGLPSDPPTDGGSSGSSSADAVANDPASVVAAYMDAFLSGDCATADDLVTDSYRSDSPCKGSNVPADADTMTSKIGTVDVDNAAGTATVPVTLTYQGKTSSAEFELVQENDQWLVNDDS
ncbi:MAG: hypothetical protein L0H31_02120, partial [Nocardioidaceae bacterium]|nr:hypothetical protein [Nocardioidaceae bacterium]